LNKLLLKYKWRGQPVPCDGAMAFDTETTLIEPGVTPELIVLTFATNHAAYIVSPDQLPEWVQMVAASGCPLVAHNFAFDYHVVHHALDFVEDIRVWKQMVEDNRVWDTMILDFLIRLANGEEDGPLRPSSLLDLCKHYLNTDISKALQCEWYQWYQKPLEEVPDEFLAYALHDARATRELYNELHPVAKHLASHNNCVIEEFGYLTHHTQIKGAIALADCSKVGIKVDQKAQQEVGVEIKLQIQDRVNWLTEHYPSLFKRDVVKKRKGQLIVNPITGVPSIDSKALRVYLLSVAAELNLPNKSIPMTDKSQEITTSGDFWSEHKHPFIQAWQDMTNKATLLNFVDQIKIGSVNPKYQALVRTGRTSCSKPNLQQMPKAEWFRKLFVPRDGTTFVIADYNAIELRCLAAICKSRFGFSRLAETFAEGVDPHAYTAASLLNMEFKTFMGLKSTEPKKFAKYRQAAKAVNFGVPGGLGAKALMAYSLAQYGVEMTLDQAKEWKNKMITEIYPELSLYLEQQTLNNMAYNLQSTPGEICNSFGIKGAGIFAFSAIADVVAGKKENFKGKAYQSTFRRYVWDSLDIVNRDNGLDFLIRSRRGSQNLRRRLFGSTVVTLTGRVRGSAEYTESCNTQFQGLASDGAKLALYEVSQVYPVVAFIHDELVVEVPTEGAGLHMDRVVKMMETQMDRVLFGIVGSKVEAQLSATWSKA
jgi:DNA polymerase I-like protein with 3'-5' exonuclease and polymerase domains